MSDEEERLKHWHSNPSDVEKFEAGEETDFGKGLVVCLAKWFQHFGDSRFYNLMCCNEYLARQESEKERYYSNISTDGQAAITFFLQSTVRIYGNEEKAFSNQITVWANAASDHLYELEVPEGEEWDEVRQLVDELQDKGLDMGHGAGLSGTRLYTWGDVEGLQHLTQEIMIKVDRILGLKPDWGQF